MFGLMSLAIKTFNKIKDKVSGNPDTSAIISGNDVILNRTQDLLVKLGVTTEGDEANQRNTQKLLREGRGH